MSEEVRAEDAAAPPRRVKRAAPKDRGVLVHVAVLAIASATAVGLWTRDKETKALVAGDVTVWSGKPADVTRVAYDTKTRKLELESKSDAIGRYFVGKVDKEAPAPKGDAGAPEKAAAPKTVTFVSVSEGEKVAEALAPLKALRGLGKVDDDRLAEFGLKEPDGTMTVTVGSAKHELVVGAQAPGSGDRYVRDAATGEVYALKGDLVRDLDAADSRMLEHDLHEWKDVDVTTAKLTAGDKSRELVRSSADGKRFWADKSSPTTNDETVGNWMSKLDRVRPTEYAAALPEGRELALRIDFGAGRPIGFIELWHAPAADPKRDAKAPPDKPQAPKNDWFVVTERTRLPAKVSASAAEQVEQDLPGLLK